MISFEKEMTYRVKVRGPLTSTAGAPLGEVQYWEMSEAWLNGPRIKHGQRCQGETGCG
jgi:hypothetical protein